jgi:ABC-2 type transport system permease protein
MSLLRSCWKTAVMESMSLTGESAYFIIGYLFRLARVVVLLALWRTILAGKSDTALTLEAVLTYTLIAEIFAEQLTPRTEIEWAMHDGGIATRFLQPMSLVAQFVSLMVGRWLFGLAFCSLPLLLAASWLGVNPAPASLTAALWFAPSLVLTIAIGVALDFCFAASFSLLEGSAYLVAQVRIALTSLLSGAVIPLAFLPYPIGDVLQWLPFASLASAPLRIYTGTGESAFLIVVQLAWAIALWPLALGLWRLNRERLALYGG